jgi:hypothetical protein
MLARSARELLQVVVEADVVEAAVARVCDVEWDVADGAITRLLIDRTVGHLWFNAVLVVGRKMHASGAVKVGLKVLDAD